MYAFMRCVCKEREREREREIYRDKKRERQRDKEREIRTSALSPPPTPLRVIERGYTVRSRTPDTYPHNPVIYIGCLYECWIGVYICSVGVSC